MLRDLVLDVHSETVRADETEPVRITHPSTESRRAEDAGSAA